MAGLLFVNKEDNHTKGNADFKEKRKEFVRGNQMRRERALKAINIDSCREQIRELLIGLSLWTMDDFRKCAERMIENIKKSITNNDSYPDLLGDAGMSENETHNDCNRGPINGPQLSPHSMKENGPPPKPPEPASSLDGEPMQMEIIQGLGVLKNDRTVSEPKFNLNEDCESEYVDDSECMQLA